MAIACQADSKLTENLHLSQSERTESLLKGLTCERSLVGEHLGVEILIGQKLG